MPLSGSPDAVQLAALRAGDERAFTEVVDQLSPRMLRLARVYVTSVATAEEAVQEAWVVVLRSLDRFEGRSSLATWVLGIVVNVARARGRHESRSRPFYSLTTDDEPIIDPDRFLPPDHERWPGHWAIPPAPWPELALENSFNAFYEEHLGAHDLDRELSFVAERGEEPVGFLLSRRWPDRNAGFIDLLGVHPD